MRTVYVITATADAAKKIAALIWAGEAPDLYPVREDARRTAEEHPQHVGKYHAWSVGKEDDAWIVTRLTA